MTRKEISTCISKISSVPGWEENQFLSDLLEKLGSMVWKRKEVAPFSKQEQQIIRMILC